MGQKRVTFVSEQKTNLHRKENINDRNHSASNLTKFHSCKRGVLLQQCKTQPPSKIECVKKSLVRNFEQAVTKKAIVSKAFKEKVPADGMLKGGNLKSKYNTRYATPELYSTLCVAKRMQQASEKDKSNDLMIHSSADNVGKADMGAALKLDSPVLRNDVAKRLDFPPDEQLYINLVALDLHDKGEIDPVIKSKCSVRKHSKKEVVNVKEPSRQHICTPECHLVFNFFAKAIPRPPSPIQIRDYPMYTATDALRDSMRRVYYRFEQKQSELMKVNLEGCELCKDRDINDPGIFDLNPKCYKCMYPSAVVSNDWFTQLSKSCSNESESNISTSDTFSKKYPGSNEMNPLSSSCASTCFSVTSGSRSKASTLPNSSLMEAGSNYNSKDHGSSYKGLFSGRRSSAKSQRTETSISGSTSMFKTDCDDNISEKSQHLETTHTKYNSGIIQDSDDNSNLKMYSYKKNYGRSVGIGNEANHSNNGNGENHSDVTVTREYSVHNNKYSGKFQESVASYSHFDTDNHRSNDIAGMFKNTQGTETNFSKYNTGKVGGTVGTGIYKTNTNGTFSAKSKGQIEYRNYNIGTSHSRDDIEIFKPYDDGKVFAHSEGTEADCGTFKPLKVCGNDATGVCKFSVQFQGTEAVSDHSSLITGDVCGTNDTGLFTPYSDSKFSTESQGTELVSDSRTNEPDRVCGSVGTGLLNTYNYDKFYTKSPGAATLINNIYGCHKSFSHAGRIDSTFGYSINRVGDTSRGYGLRNCKPCQVPTNSSETSSKSQVSEVNSNDRLSSNNNKPYISSNSSNQASRNCTDSYEMDTHINSPDSRSSFADIVSCYSEYGAPWYYGTSQPFTKLIKSRIGEWTSSETQFCYSVGQDNRNIISGTVIRHEAEEENSDNSENKSEGDGSEEQ
ncbi:serine-rich adhesin for platelets [Anabrus simplex]|uniref:serine-rich adhesin for platelets n=1 Tax=Anabrus simplex TaxID=316456 RepID=UPI0035A2A9AE